MDIKYDKLLGNLTSYYIDLRNVLEDPVFIDRIESLKQALSREKLNILIVGEFSRGKSTFINAILGKPYLPANVNPTTATINVITFSETPGLTIEYVDGSLETKDLPQEKINKFLDDFVSVKNKSADKVKLISLKLSEINRFKNIQIVDTPGVNDLDESREEITFKYLNEADACIILLDSQQPLSSSERMFIESKVLQRDIKKLFFVINKIDQVAKGSLNIFEQISRIENYVREKLQSELSLPEEPRIYSVSSLEALRAKVKFESSEWSDRFMRFESDLIKFASDIGSQERLTLHYSRLLSIVDSSVAHLSSKIKILKMNREEIEKSILETRKERELVSKEIKLIKDEIETIKVNLSDRIKILLTNTISTIRLKTGEILRSAGNVEELLRVRYIFNEEVKTAIDAISLELSEKVLELENRVVDRQSITASENSKSLTAYRPSTFEDNNSILEAGTNFNKSLIQNDAFKTIAIAGSGGLVGAAIIGGPVGVAIAAVGAIILNKKFQAERQVKIFNKIKEDVSNELSVSLKKLEMGLSESSKKLVSAEFDPTATSINVFLDEKLKQLSSKLEFQTGIDHQKYSENTREAETLNGTIIRLENLKKQCINDCGELSDYE
jgi:small GTP-binding protein